MRKLVFGLSAVVLVAVAQAQCPIILNCPQGSPLVCDISDNDVSLWNDAPHTWSPALESADLYEGAVDFSLRILPCAAGGSLDISYVLLLDLDNDDLLETAVSSDNLPPAGVVFFNNAFTPGYTGGDSLKFDKRPLPDSLIFRFALEITASWDTVIARLRWKSGSSFFSPRLPEGKHRLIWKVEQGSTVKFCEPSFRIKDCLPPTMECEENWFVSLGANGLAALDLNDILVASDDNVTPDNLIETSIRVAGEGDGFPLDSAGNPVQTLTFGCSDLGEHPIELWGKDRSNNTHFCLTTLTLTDNTGVCDQFPVLCARPFWDTTLTMKQVRFEMLWVDTSQNLISQPLLKLPDSCAVFYDLPPAPSFSLTAEWDSNYRNGVSTFDLLQISRHILGVQTFDAPWKWLAADANKNGSITTFDVVELRKLILGIYDDLPATTSWRFFVNGCDFQPDAFPGYCPSEYSFQTTTLQDYPLSLPFNAVKIGDVNGSAIPNPDSLLHTDDRTGPVFFQMPDLVLEARKTYEIPLRIAEAVSLSGFQFGLWFDSEVVEIEKVDSEILEDWDGNSFAQPAPGVLNVSWFSAEPQVVFPNEKLLTLRLKASRDVRLKDVFQLENDWLAAEVYETVHRVQPLQIVFSNNFAASGSPLIFPPQPNPTTAGASIPIQLATDETVRIQVLDLSAKLLWFNELPLGNGAHMLEIPAATFPQAGVFVWRVNTGELSQSGKIVRE
jgi:hypothetical protein